MKSKTRKKEKIKITSQRTINNKINDQPGVQEIAKLKAEIEKLKLINQTGNTNMDHIHQNQKKNQKKKSKNRPKASQTGGQIEKIEILSVISFLEYTMRTLSSYRERLKKKLDINLIKKEM